MAPPACAAPTVGDWAIDDSTALLFSGEAPIAGSGPRDDKTAVWAFVPDAFDYAKPEVLFYFHGHDNYVKVGYCDHKEGLGPNWVSADRRWRLAGKASGPKYGLNKLPTTPHAPIVMVPEVGVYVTENDDAKYANVLDTPQHYQQWLKTKQAWDQAVAAHNEAVKKKSPSPPPMPPPPPKPDPVSVPSFTVRETAGRMATDLDQIKKMIDDCCDRLRRLPKRVTTTSTYLDVAPAKLVNSSKLKRLYLTGHSGGGVPLAAACKANLARLTGKDDMPTDLWVFDATYGGGLDEYSSFCKELSDKGKLGNGPGLSRFVAVVIKNSSTDVDNAAAKEFHRMTAIVKKMRDDGLAVKEVEFTGAADIPMIKSTVMCNPITVIRNIPSKSKVQHDDIPTTFIPILLETAGQKGSDCGGSAPTGFLLKVIDTNDKPLVGANVTVKQQESQILASKLDNNGSVFVQGHDLSQPCDVLVEGFGGLGREGHIDPDEPDDGTLPEYDPGSADEDGGSCGGDYTPPAVIT